MHVLVTGCAGFIGARVCHHLLDDGHDVVGADDLNDAYDPRLKRWRLERLAARPRFAFRHADVAERRHVDALFADARFDAVVNLAARAGVRQSVADPWVYVRTNATGTLNLLEACRGAGTRKFVLASTSSLYGSHNATPFREDADASRPLSPYAASKSAAESMLAAYAHLHGIDGIVLRYFTVYGPAGRPDMSPFRFVRWIVEGDPLVVYGDGTQRRDFTHVDDIARGTVAALHASGLHVVNLGSDRPVALSRFIEIIEQKAGRKARIQHRPKHRADMDATWADIGKARSVLGWEPKVPLEVGVQETVDWYLENRDWASRIDIGAL
jgi:UDP-glucuronate 4-epimerase